MLAVGGLQQHRATAASCLLPIPRAAPRTAWTCCSSLEPRAELGPGELPHRGHRCPRATRTTLEVALPAHCGPRLCLAGGQTARTQPSLSGTHRPQRGQPGDEGSLRQAEHLLTAQHIPASWPPSPCPPRSTAPANIYPPHSGVYKAQLISVCNATTSLCRAGWQRCSGTA